MINLLILGFILEVSSFTKYNLETSSAYPFIQK